MAKARTVKRQNLVILTVPFEKDVGTNDRHEALRTMICCAVYQGAVFVFTVLAWCNEGNRDFTRDVGTPVVQRKRRGTMSDDVIPLVQGEDHYGITMGQQ
jgi:hypothetical protein